MNQSPRERWEAHYGGSYFEEATSDVVLKPVARVFVVRMNASGNHVRLPQVADVPLGGPYLVINDGTDAYDLESAAGGSLTTLPTNQSAVLWLILDAAGTRQWQLRSTGTVSRNNPVSGEAYALAIKESVFDVNVRSLVDATFGYDGTEPASVVLTIEPEVAVGASSTAAAALVVGSWPAGSSIQIINNGFIDGCGGQGGDATYAPDLPGAVCGTEHNGRDGGAALDAGGFAVSVDNANGQIRGGGGGGGGTCVSVSGLSGINYCGAGGGGQGRRGGLPGEFKPAWFVGTYPSGGAPVAPGGVGLSILGTPFPAQSPGYNMGGAGGAWASAGSVGPQVAGTASGYTVAYGTAGAGGAAVLGSGNVTWVNTGIRIGSLLP